jgi:uncharacterized protein
MNDLDFKLVVAGGVFACAAISSSASATSFDCGKAATAVEKTICAEPSLSALDDKLAVLYKDMLAVATDKASIVRLQHEWIAPDSDLDGNRSTCEERADTRLTCLTAAYDKRLTLLAAMKPLLQMSDQPADEGWRFDLRKVSDKYDFTIRMLNQCELDKTDDSFTCEQPGLVYVSKKGQALPFQVMPMNNIFLSLYKAAPASAAQLAEYGEQSTILVGDFHFDGEEDIAIRNGNRSSYNGPSFDVWLKSGKQGGWRYSAALTGLVQNSLGFFQVDVKRKRLMTSERSGCCYHVTTEYQLVRDQPVPTIRTIHDGLVEGRYNYVYEERWAGKRWQRISTRRTDRQK